VAFARYTSEPGGRAEDTKLVKFTAMWERQEMWVFPPAVIARWGGMSSSGGTVAPNRVFVTTGHHAPELYVLTLPVAGQELVLSSIISIESEGQGIALDRATGQLYSIQRRTAEVLVSILPNVAPQ
jgi:hypothetical protein